MKVFGPLTLIAFSLIFSACGMRLMSHNELIQKYVGLSIEDVIAEMGAPNSTSTLPSGSTVYGFITETERTEKTGEVRSTSSNYGRTGRSQGQETVEIYSKVKDVCRMTFMADKRSIVTSAKSEGPGCQGKWVKEQG